MAEALDKTLNTMLEDLEINQMQQLASDSYFNNNTTCSCRGNSLRERGRNFCLNNQRVQESDSNDSSVSVFVY